MPCLRLWDLLKHLNMKSKCLPQRNGKEDGGGGVVYAMYFIAIFVVTVVFAYSMFSVNLYLLKNELSIGLHLIEGVAMTSNRGMVSTDVSTSKLEKVKIIPTATASDTWGMNEKEQVEAIGKTYAEYFIKHFQLRDGKYPTKGILHTMCDENDAVLIGCPEDSETTRLQKTGIIYIYEPYYDVTITKRDKDTNAIFPDNYVFPENEIPNIIFEVKYEITGWITYKLHYLENVYQTCEKEYNLNAPLMINGKIAEGATILSAAQVRFTGLSSVFCNIAADTFNVQEVKALDVVLEEKDTREVIDGN